MCGCTVAVRVVLALLGESFVSVAGETHKASTKATICFLIGSSEQSGICKRASGAGGEDSKGIGML